MKHVMKKSRVKEVTVVESAETIYDLELLAKGNYHIHTNFSECANKEMTLANIAAEAEKNNLETIALVDHHHCWTKNMLENIENLKSEIRLLKPDIKILVGAELSAYGIGKYSDSQELNEKLDYRLYACNHYHLDFWEHPKEQSPRAYAEHLLAVLKELILSERTDCIAHPFIASYLRDKVGEPALVTKSISDNELGDILELGKNHRVCWEINKSAFMDDPDFARRYWHMGKEAGVSFRFGTDAHRLEDIDTRQFIQRLQAIIKGQ